MEKILIFTDGASRGNPGSGGWGAIIVTDGIGVQSRNVTELGGGEKSTTNNRMELQAALNALSFIAVAENSGEIQLKPSRQTAGRRRQIVIYTDSSYVLRGATEWLSVWENTNWRTSAKKAVLNEDLWRKLSKALTAKNGPEIKWRLISGHVGVPGNERADEIAAGFADGAKPALFSGPMERYSINILNVSHNVAQKEKRTGSKNRSRAKAYSYVSKVKGEITIHKTWAECEKRVKGVPDTLYKKALDREEERAIIENFGNKK